MKQGTKNDAKGNSAPRYTYLSLAKWGWNFDVGVFCVQIKIDDGGKSDLSFFAMYKCNDATNERLRSGPW